MLLGFFGGPFLPSVSMVTLGIWFSVVVGWVWLTVLSANLSRATDPS